MSRLRFDVLPTEWSAARATVDAAFRSLREVLDGGWRWSEQTRVVSVVIDTAEFPAVFEVRGLKSRPSCVAILSAVERGDASGAVISFPTILWSWRAGVIAIAGVDPLDASTRYDCVIAVME